jgi:hypothetical protein
MGALFILLALFVLGGHPRGLHARADHRHHRRDVLLGAGRRTDPAAARTAPTRRRHTDPAIVHAGGMPDPVATRWSSDGHASGPSRRDVELAMSIVVVMIGAAFTGLAERFPSVVHARMLVVAGHVASVAWPVTTS